MTMKWRPSGKFHVGVGSELRLDNLDGDGAFESEVCGAVNSAHAARADFAFDAKPSGDDMGDIHFWTSFGVKVAAGLFR
jgi:hypothetical protein